MALGLLVLLDVLLRWRDLEAFYSDAGVLSRLDMLEQGWLPNIYHLFLAAGSVADVSLLFFAWACSAFCLMVGYQTRLAGALTWYFVTSIQLRNPLVTHGGDDFLRLLLFWTPFLPLQARWSMDALRNPEWGRLPNVYRSVATIGVTLQFFVLYFFAAVLKNGEDWLRTGDALYYALSIDQFTTGLGAYLVNFPGLLRPVSFLALGWEYLLALLLLLPQRWRWPRMTFLICAAVFHLGIASLLHFGLFMPIMLGSLLVFLPTSFLDRWTRTERPLVPSNLPGSYRLPRPLAVLLALNCFYVAYVNLYSIEHVAKLPGWAKPVALVTFQHQHWHLFGPRPLREDGWFVLERNVDGKVSNLYGEASGAKPELVSSQFANQRWRRWMQNLVHTPMESRAAWAGSTVRYLGNRWETEHPGEGKRIHYRLLWVLEFTPPPGEELTTVTHLLAEWTPARVVRAR